MVNGESKKADREDVPTLGEHLRAEREARNLSAEHVAQHLHLDVWVVEAMEANNFSALGAPVFAKGHLRQYAAMLGLASDELMVEYYQAQDKPDQPPLVANYHPLKRGNVRWALWLGLAIVLLVAGAFVFQWVRGSSARPGSVSQATQETPVISQLPLSSGATREPVEESTTEMLPLTQESVVPQEPVSQAADAVESQESSLLQAVTEVGTTVSEAEPISISLYFERESWAEVYDGERKRLMYDMGAQNSTRNFSALPPVQVFLGFADGVQIQVEGQPYELTPLERRGNTARLRIEESRP